MRTKSQGATASPQGVWVWRHPRPIGHEGRCIGQTDLPVDRRRAKRLARQIQRLARRQGLPRQVYTSHLRRSRLVGMYLRRWGWAHAVWPALAETHFGAWEGQAWTAIGAPAIDQWCVDLLHHQPGGGESVHQLLVRVTAVALPEGATVVGHGGWITARAWLATGQPWLELAANWPAPVAYGACVVLPASLPAEEAT